MINQSIAHRNSLGRHPSRGLLHDGTELSDRMQCFFSDASG
jgi:hypothetical protein